MDRNEQESAWTRVSQRAHSMLEAFGSRTSYDDSYGSSQASTSFPCGPTVAKMASHAIFQYNVLAIDDTHNTCTNMIVKMTILRLLGSSDDKEKIGVARSEGPPPTGVPLPG